jgi:hypothetical protein
VAEAFRGHDQTQQPVLFATRPDCELEGVAAVIVILTFFTVRIGVATEALRPQSFDLGRHSLDIRELAEKR